MIQRNPREAGARGSAVVVVLLLMVVVVFASAAFLRVQSGAAMMIASCTMFGN